MSILSDAKIRALKPRAKAYKQSDYDGLYLLVNPSGSKLWRFKYRYLGKEKLLALGKYPEISLADARSQRDEARSLVANGTDPSQARNAAKAAETERFEQTFQKIAEQLLIKKRREGRAPATIEKTIWFHKR